MSVQGKGLRFLSRVSFFKIINCSAVLDSSPGQTTKKNLTRNVKPPRSLAGDPDMKKKIEEPMTP